MTPSLTQDAVAFSMSRDFLPQDIEGFQPTLQLLHVQKVSSGGSDRYRLIYSDGEYHCQSLLATKLNDYFESQNFTPKCIIKLTRFVVNLALNKRLIITLGIEKLRDYSEKIGNPVRFDTAENFRNGGSSAMDVDPAPVDPGKALVRPKASGTTNPLPAGFAPLHPIEAISPYIWKWTICARVSKKWEIRRWSNKHGHGTLFSVNLMDDTGEIRATGYNELVDNLYPTLEEGKAYWVTNARVYLTAKVLPNQSNEYEIMLEKQSKIISCEDESAVRK